MKLEIISGMLAGSLLTIFIKNLFEILKKHQEHRYELKQRYFDKKIEVSIEGAKKWYLMSSLFQYCSVILEKALEAAQNQNINPKIFFEEFGREIKKIEKILTDFPSSIYIFYDLNFRENSFFDIQNKFLELISLFEQFKKYEGITTVKIEGETQLKELAKIANELLNKLGHISKICSSNYEKILEILAKMRTEMKKYE